MHRWLARVGWERMRALLTVSAVIVLIGLPGAIAPLMAQSCTADVQCREGGLPRTYCAGNSVVTVRSVCTGSCRTVEESRVPCPGVCAGGRCSGAPSAPVDRFDNTGCRPSCRCVRGVLTIYPGFATRGTGCVRQIRRCPGGCSCDPVPRCRGG